jgi:sialate O-acetylesterase
MVLQQGSEIHIWGWADPNEKVTVNLGAAQATTTADANRQWSVHLPGMKAGGPYTLVVQGKKTLFVRDVLIGEVWVASGQSNMAYALKDAAGGAQEVKKADYPEIRLFTVPRRIAMAPQQDIAASSWQICTPDTVKEFSAVAYGFARDLHKKLGVPVGIIESAWPGTPIEDWMPWTVFQSDDDLRTVLSKWNGETPEVKQYAERPLDFALDFKNFKLVRTGSADTDPVTQNNFYKKSPSSGALLHWNYDWASGPDTYFEQSGEDSAQEVHLHGLLDNSRASMLTGRWSPEGTPKDLSGYEGIRFLVRGSGGFRVRFLQPTITDTDDYSSKFYFTSSQWEEVTIRYRDLHQEGWGVVKELTPSALTGITIESVTKLGYPNRPPAGLFNGMISPLLPLPIRGVIWYQGESNALSAQLYRKELPAMISAWRQGWDRKDLAFEIVQLPNHGVIPSSPMESPWAELREAQLKTAQAIENTGLIVTIDLGDPDNVHPARKLEVAERTALWAMSNTYKQPIVYSGPVFESAKTEGSQVRLKFRNMGGTLQARGGGSLEGFAIAGSDRRFQWATARIEGDEIVVSSTAVPAPVAVRYAWGESPNCNLINEAGFPASPFRTDDWPGITAATAH